MNTELKHVPNADSDSPGVRERDAATRDAQEVTRMYQACASYSHRRELREKKSPASLLSRPKAACNPPPLRVKDNDAVVARVRADDIARPVHPTPYGFCAAYGLADDW